VLILVLVLILVFTIMAVILTIMATGFVRRISVAIIKILLFCLTPCGCWSIRPLDDLVYFTPVKPDATALGAIVDFNTLSFRDNKINRIADWAFHGNFSPSVLCIV
jgi:hypothetical protein